ncbi:MarR family winged helix-turn-helix transcriptional regulator [Mycobacteroides sp. LB1]|uniref:MarR family winged helix-turn-helix transcriptional regulator n=1 Tax=Mycobacteroides sp. LB1 TaxID=2750814 RepID=UPI0015DE8FF1|nr:MarR family transcriptional regulator [Mycobacteroides sp. LB1]
MANKTWLNAREQRAWRGFHLVSNELTAELGRQLARDSGVSAADYAVLVALSETPTGRMRFRDLGQILGWERSRISHQINRMETRRTVERQSCDDDARGFNASITEAGRAVIAAAAPLHVRAVRHCFIDLLTPEQLETLGDITDIVATHLANEHNAHPTAAS